MKEFFTIPMQFFAEEPEGTEPTGTAGVQEPAPQGTEPQKTEPAPPAEKTFTQSDLDRIVAERLARLQKKHEAELEEAAQVAKMTAAQKAEHDAKKREDELVQREKLIAEKELRYTALGTLEESGLPASLVDCLNLSSADSCNESIEALKKAWPEALTAAVDARLKSDPPAFSGGNKSTDPFLSEFGM